MMMTVMTHTPDGTATSSLYWKLMTTKKNNGDGRNDKQVNLFNLEVLLSQGCYFTLVHKTTQRHLLLESTNKELISARKASYKHNSRDLSR